MKKLAYVLLGLILLTGCAGGDKPENTEIKIYTRDSSSGTREAFESIIGVKEITDKAAEAASNGDMAKKVGSTEGSIGYVSLSTDFEANGVKPLSYEGVEPTIETVNNGTYSLARPFSYVTRADGDFGSTEKQELVAAFIDFIANSKEGRQIVLAAGGIADVESGTPWATLAEKHPIVTKDNSAIVIKTAGSTSVEKTLTAAMEAFIPMAGNFQYQPGQTGSSDGFKRVLGGEKDSANAADIGFASREFKSEETVNDGLLHGEYAKDAVVVVVPKSSSLTNLTKQNLADIYSGTIANWSEIK